MEVRKVAGVWVIAEVVDWVRDVDMRVEKRRIEPRRLDGVRREVNLSSMYVFLSGS